MLELYVFLRAEVKFCGMGIEINASSTATAGTAGLLVITGILSDFFSVVHMHVTLLHTW